MADSKMIRIFDTTLRDGEQSPGCSMDLSEKIEVARQLERLKVDIIEAGFAIASPGDFNSVKTIAETIRNCKVASLSRAKKEDIDAAYEALKGAVSPRIHTFIATSPIHMEYKLKMAPEDVLVKAREMVAYAKTLCGDIEFSAEDATRSDPEFLVRIFEAVIKAGATVINVPDTVGYTFPEEYTNLLNYLFKNVKGIEKVDISVHCHNDLGMAVANSLAAVKAGATQVECTINGIGERSGNAALEEVVMGLMTRRDIYNAAFNVDTTQIYRSSKLLSGIIGMLPCPNKAIVGGNAFAHESGIHQHGMLANRATYEIMTPESIGLPKNELVLGKHSGRHAFEDRLITLGFSLSKEEIDEAFNKFKILADKKKTVSDRDIEALLVIKVDVNPNSYKLERFVVNSGNTITATAIVRLSRGDEVTEEAAMGDGPVDAAFKAIEKITGSSYSLEEYNIHSVSEGEDALGEVLLKLRDKETLVAGRGLSTDIIESSILAYLNAVNKIKAVV